MLIVSTAALLVAKLALSAEPPLEAAADVAVAATPAPAATEPDAPALPDSLLRAARVHADEKRFDRAAADLRRALAARPGDRTIASLLARVL
ncbi:MAG TPA: tetratricopeptide repeat protein, partial [Candidatus Eisenbacteria bacterium]|nr:tetratricopeptide repeat protein [Candidatus Eisenbacteria bacterium]